MPSNNEITLIREGPHPDKIMDEGDTLQINAKIHSFYWNYEGPQKHDYEPIAMVAQENWAISRYHYR